jgi:hypothetical protein
MTERNIQVIISNQYTSEIGVAIAWTDNSECQNHGGFKKIGWYSVEPGQSSKVVDLKVPGGIHIQLAYYAYAVDGKHWNAEGTHFGSLPTTIHDESTSFGPECVDKVEPLGPVKFRLSTLNDNDSSVTVVLNKDNTSP